MIFREASGTILTLLKMVMMSSVSSAVDKVGFEEMFRSTYEWEGKNPLKILEVCTQSLFNTNLNCTESAYLSYRVRKYFSIVGDTENKWKVLQHLFDICRQNSDPIISVLYGFSVAEHHYEEYSEKKVPGALEEVKKSLDHCKGLLEGQLDAKTYLNGKYFFLLGLLKQAQADPDRAYGHIVQAEKCFQEQKIPYLTASCSLLKLFMYIDWAPERFISHFSKRAFQDYPILVYRGLSVKLRLVEQKLKEGSEPNRVWFVRLLKEEKVNMGVICDRIMAAYPGSVIDAEGNFRYQKMIF